jgi:hypothetical protein
MIDAKSSGNAGRIVVRTLGAIGKNGVMMKL